MFGVFKYLLILFVMYYAAALFTSERLRIRRLSEWVVAFSIIVISQQILTCWVLGSFKHLRPVELFASNIIVSIILILLSSPGTANLKGPFRNLGRSLKAILKLCRRADILVLLCLNIALLAFQLYRAIVYPPYGYDEHLYHLSQVGFMLQDGDLAFIPYYPLNSFPRNFEITYFFNVAFTSHQVYLNALQIPYILLAVAASYTILRNAGCRRHPSVNAALTYPMIPVIIQQATVAYIDAAAAGVFLAALAFLLSISQRPATIGLAGLALGVLAGGKGSGLILTACVVFLWLLLWGLPIALKRDGVRKLVSMLVILIICFSLNGMWLYVRNLSVYGNPVHPYQVKIGNTILFDGGLTLHDHVKPEIIGPSYDNIMNRSWLNRQLYSFSEPAKQVHYSVVLGGFGPVFPIVFMPAIGAAILIALLQRKWWFLKTMVVFFASLVAMGELAFWLRYVLFFYVAGMLGYAFIMGISFRWPGKYLLHYTVIALCVVSCFFFTRVPAWKTETFKSFLQKGPTYWHSSLLPAKGMHKSFFSLVYPEFTKPGTVFFVDRSFIHRRFLSLWNLDFSNRIVYSDALSKDEWFSDLEASGADFVIVVSKTARDPWWNHINPITYPVPRNGEYSAEWIKSEQGKFKLERSAEGFQLYKVLR